MKKIININSFIFFAIIIFIVVWGNNAVLNSLVLPQIRAGEWMIDNHSILTKDIFSYTMENKEWINNNWLLQLIFASIYRFLGLRGIVLFTAFIIATTFSLLVSYVYKRQKNILVTLVLIFGAIISSMAQWLAMPFIISILFVVAYYIILSEFLNENNIRMIYIVPFLHILWVNFNEDFVLGTGLMLIFTLGIFLNIFLDGKKYEKKKIYILCIISIILILEGLLNPFGIKLYGMIKTAYTFNFMYKAKEWLTPDFHGIAKMAGLYMVAIILGLAAIKKWKPEKKIGYEYVLTFIFVQYLFLFAQRFQIFFVLLATLCFVEYFDLRDIKFSSKLYNKILDKLYTYSNELFEDGIHKVSWLFIFSSLFLCISFNSALEKKYPTEVDASVLEPIKYIKENHITGNGFHNDMFGNLIIWEKIPGMKVFLDNRVNFYSDAVFVEYIDFINMKGKYKSYFEKYDFQWILITEGMIVQRFFSEDSSNWVEVHHGTWGVILLKKEYYEKIKDKIKIDK